MGAQQSTGVVVATTVLPDVRATAKTYHHHQHQDVVEPKDEEVVHVELPNFRTRFLRVPTMAPCYVLRDLVFQSSGLRLSPTNLYARVAEDLGCQGNVRMSLWDGVSAIQTHGTAVAEPTHKRPFKRVMSRYRFVRPGDARGLVALLRQGVLVGALLRRSEDDTCVPVTVHAYDPTAPAAPASSGAVVVCRAYGPRVAEDVRVAPDALECLWALVRTRTALPEVCMLA